MSIRLSAALLVTALLFLSGSRIRRARPAVPPHRTGLSSQAEVKTPGGEAGRADRGRRATRHAGRTLRTRSIAPTRLPCASSVASQKREEGREKQPLNKTLDASFSLCVCMLCRSLGCSRGRRFGRHAVVFGPSCRHVDVRIADRYAHHQVVRRIGNRRARALQ
jgi:hypothetical protein